MLDLETIGVEFNTAALRKVRARSPKPKSRQPSSRCRRCCRRVRVRRRGVRAQCRAADDLSGTFQRLESGALKLSDAENRLVRSLVSEAKQIGMTNAERERYMAKQAGMSDAAAQMAGSAGEN